MQQIETETASRRLRLIKKKTRRKTEPRTVALTSMRLDGRDFRVGEPISAAILEKLTPRVRAALVDTGRIGPPSDLPVLTSAERKAQRSVEAAQAALAEAKRFAGDLKRKVQAEEAALTAFERQREPLAYAAYSGDKEAKRQLEKTADELVKRRVRLRDLEIAAAGAEKVAKDREAAVRATERKRQAAELDRIVARHLETVDQIQKQVDGLAPLVKRYRDGLATIARLTGSPSRHLVSTGRVADLLSTRWNMGEHVPPARRIANLRDTERSIIEGAIRHWRNSEIEK